MGGLVDLLAEVVVALPKVRGDYWYSWAWLPSRTSLRLLERLFRQLMHLALDLRLPLVHGVDSALHVLDLTVHCFDPVVQHAHCGVGSVDVLVDVGCHALHVVVLRHGAAHHHQHHALEALHGRLLVARRRRQGRRHDSIYPCHCG